MQLSLIKSPPKEQVGKVEQSANDDLIKIAELDQKLKEEYKNKFINSTFLSRQVVSFQANKNKPVYRWYKYKEAFSASLVEFLLRKYEIPKGKLLDPFAGVGTSLFASSCLGFGSDGIELLPIGQEIINARLTVESSLNQDETQLLRKWSNEKPWNKAIKSQPLNELRITKGAYPKETKKLCEQFLSRAKNESSNVKQLLHFALLSVLESISYTRKDGQYLRWDHRSGKREDKNTFNKGRILGFGEAISLKLNEMISDIEHEDTFAFLDTPTENNGAINLVKGSCLEIMPGFENNQYEVIITSPPYCNRYDYTRTYALELALLGVDEQGISRLRQDMLSCTVENREKDLLAINQQWQSAIEATDNEATLQGILDYLEKQRLNKALNNNGIPRMVRGYFYEMACVIQECARVLKPGGHMFMVNDNVRYAGAGISVDTILSHIAENIGFEILNILVLPQNKGNSSQQMGLHGREALRKCVYVWKKPS